MMKSKKFVPVFAVILLLAVFAGVAFYLFNNSKANTQIAEDEGPELPADQRPYASLTPTEDGHYMDMIISNISVPEADKIEFELFYTTGEGNNQGTRGSIKLKGNDTIKNQILLGSESNGKFRFDTGVELGTLTVKFRDKSGKVIGRTATTWKLETEVSELKSADGKFAYKLEEESKAWFVTMNTLGLPGNFDGVTASEPYGVFTSSEDELAGEVTLGDNLNMWDFENEKWVKMDSNSSEMTGVFVASN